MFQAVENQLIGNQSYRNRSFDMQTELPDIDMELNAIRCPFVDGHQFARERREIAANFHHTEIIRGVQLLVYVSYRSHAAFRLFKCRHDTRIDRVARLQAQQTDNHLQIVLHPVMNFPHQHAFLF